jgi:hypothetical protein
MTIGTTAPSATGSFARRFTPISRIQVPATVFVIIIGGSTLLLSVRRQRRWGAVLALLAFGAIVTGVGCGGGGGGGGGLTNPGTPVGNYTGVTVTATIGTVTQSISTISVNVE